MDCICYHTRSFSFGHHTDIHFESRRLFFLPFFYFLMRSFKRFVEIVRCFSFKGPLKGIAIDFRLRTVALLARCDPHV